MSDLTPNEEREKAVLPEFVPSTGLWMSEGGESMPVIGFIRVYQEMDQTTGFHLYLPVTPYGVMSEVPLENYFGSREAADEGGVKAS